jgi:predicted DCC family thiol-disulfide oxidoreductase YuxK
MPESSFLLYDGECPVCQRYVLWVAVREARPDIRLINAREAESLVFELRARGIEVNDTMVLRLDNQEYLGGSAMAKLLELSNDRSRLQRLASMIAAPPLKRLYPLLAVGRKALLKMLGRPLIK